MWRVRNEIAIIDGAERITYGDLRERAAGIAAWLRRTLDPRRGDVIAASLPNSWQFVASFMAVTDLGCVFMPCNPRWREREVSWFAAKLGFRGIITEDQIRFESGEPAAASHDPAVYLATSGSTGAPRIVPRTRRNLFAGAENVGRVLDVGPGRRFLAVIPFYHSNGFHNSMFLPLMHGATIVMARQFVPAACAERIRRERVDTLIGSPFIYSLLAEKLSSSPPLCISAGAPMPAAVAERWRKRFGVRVRQLYGSTETSAISIDCAAGDAAPDCVGMPVPGAEVRILESGEITVRSPAVMSGYVGEPEINGFFHTRDLGYLASDGLHLTGRIRRVINIAGIKVDPVEVERVVETLAGVFACRVDAARSGHGGELIRARVALRAGAQVTRADLIEHCRSRLAEYKLPRIIEIVEATISGKTPAEWDMLA